MATAGCLARIVRLLPRWPCEGTVGAKRGQGWSCTAREKNCSVWPEKRGYRLWHLLCERYSLHLSFDVLRVLRAVRVGAWPPSQGIKHIELRGKAVCDVQVHVRACSDPWPSMASLIRGFADFAAADPSISPWPLEKARAGAVWSLSPHHWHRNAIFIHRTLSRCREAHRRQDVTLQRSTSCTCCRPVKHRCRYFTL